MIPSLKDIASRRRQSAQKNILDFADFRLGLNTIQSAKAIKHNELTIAINVVINSDGALENRNGLTRYTTSSIGITQKIDNINSILFSSKAEDIRFFADVDERDDREWYASSGRSWAKEDVEFATSGADEFFVTQPDNALYLLNTNKSPDFITYLKGSAEFIAFGDIAVILDGSYVKYWDRLTSSVKLAYDDGSGESGFQVYQLGLVSDTGISLYSGSTEKAGVVFESQLWDRDYSIPLTSMIFSVTRVGNPTGNITCEIYDIDNVLLASSNTVVDSSTVSLSNEEITFYFSSAYIESLTIYKAVIAFSGGDPSNYIQLNGNANLSNGNTVICSGDSVWGENEDILPLVGVKPGKPPVASSGLLQNNRLFLIGNTFKKGILFYSNLNTIFDWSTPNGGGWLGVIDNNDNNYAINAIVSLYNQIYMFGSQAQPYLCSLTGSSPDDFAISPVMQSISASRRTIQNTINDIWFVNSNGVNTLSGVQQYGDLRTSNESDKIANLIQPYWDETRSFSGYNPVNGHFLLKQYNTPFVFVAHTSFKNVDRGKVFYPWTMFLFVRELLTDDTLYEWVSTGVGNEYRLQLLGGGDPGIIESEYLCFNDVIIKKSANIGALDDYEWAFGSVSGIDYDTFFISLPDGVTASSRISVVLSPTCFKNLSDFFLIAFDDGYIYKFDGGTYLDNNFQYPIVVGMKNIDNVFNDFCVEKYKLHCNSENNNSSVNIEIFKEKIKMETLHTANADIIFNNIDF